MVGFVAEGVAEHFADSAEFVLAVEGKDHAEESVELGALHALAEHEDVFGESLFVFGLGKIEILAPEGAAVGDDEIGFFLDGGDIFEHRLAFVGIDAEGADHID